MNFKLNTCASAGGFHFRVFCRWMLSRLSCIKFELFVPLMHYVPHVSSH